MGKYKSLPIVLDTNVFVWLSSRQARFSVLPFSQDHLHKTMQNILSNHDVYIPSIVQYEFGKRQKNDGVESSPLIDELFKNDELLLSINNDTFAFLSELNDILGDFSEQVKFQDKIILSLGMQHLGNSFYVLTADYNDFVEKIHKKKIVKVEDVFWILCKEKIRKDGEDICEKFVAHNLYLLYFGIE